MYGIYLFVINMFSFNLDALVPVTTVQLGEPTTFTCVLPIDLYYTGKTQGTSNSIVVQWPTVSNPVRPGDSVTLQCTVLSDSQNKTCPGDHSVYWFRSGSDKSHPNIIYTNGNRHDECDTQKSCIYHFSKNFSSFDAGTYYCAVATCGEI